MTRVLLLMCSSVFLVGACSKPEPKQTNTVLHIHHVKVLSVKSLTQTNDAGDAGGDALAGAIVGAAVGFPTTGAIIGAASSKDKKAVTADGCKFSTEVNGKRLYFIGGKVGDGSYDDIETCSLLTPGDTIEVREYAKGCPALGHNRGDPNSRFRWRNYCLRSAI